MRKMRRWVAAMNTKDRVATVNPVSRPALTGDKIDKEKTPRDCYVKVGSPEPGQSIAANSWEKDGRLDAARVALTRMG